MANLSTAFSRLDLVMQSKSSFQFQEMRPSLRIHLLIHRLEAGTLPKYRPIVDAICEIARKHKSGVGKERLG